MSAERARWIRKGVFLAGTGKWREGWPNVSSLRGPHDAGRSAGWIETRVRTMAFVGGAELPVDLGGKFAAGGGGVGSVAGFGSGRQLTWKRWALRSRRTSSRACPRKAHANGELVHSFWFTWMGCECKVRVRVVLLDAAR